MKQLPTLESTPQNLLILQANEQSSSIAQTSGIQKEVKIYKSSSASV